LFVLPAFISSAAAARTILVGPSRSYSTLQQVVSILQPDDTVLVDGDAVYTGGVSFTRAGTASKRILIRGVDVNGKRPIIDGGVNAVAFIDGADHHTFENFEIRNAVSRGIYHQSNDLIIRNVIVHDSHTGLMGADNGSGSLLLEYAEFYGNGSSTQVHQIYMATDEGTHPGSVFRMQFCYTHDATGGNNVKSRAERNEIYYNWIEGAMYHELELIGPDPMGGVAAGLKREDSDVVGNVLWKKTTPTGGQKDFYVVRFGGDGTGETFGRYRFVNNTVLMGSSAVFRLFDGIESVEMHNNVFHHPGGGSAPLVRTAEAGWSGGEVISGRNNWVHTDLTAVPQQWTGTLTGADPGFENVDTHDLKPAPGSPLVHAGTAFPESPAGHAFPDPLFPPEFEPPLRKLPGPGAVLPRPSDGSLDIGAFERTMTVGTRDLENLPASFQLDQNYPNPFNPSTTVRYHLPILSHVKLVVYDLLGRDVAVLVDDPHPPGTYDVRFDGTGLAGGVYMYRLQTERYAASRRMVVLK
jgi:hypothetical protein